MEGTVIIAWILLDLDKTISLDWIFSIRYFVGPKGQGCLVCILNFPSIASFCLLLVHCQKWNSSICSFHFVEFPLFRNISLRSSCALQSFTIASTRNFSSFKSQNFYRQSNYQPVVFDTLQQHSSTFKVRKTSFNAKINVPIFVWNGNQEKIDGWAKRQPGVVGWRPDFFETIDKLSFFVLIQKCN